MTDRSSATCAAQTGEFEIGGAEDGNRVYPSIEAAKKYSGCWQECGIVEVRVLFSKVIEPSRIGERS